MPRITWPRGIEALGSAVSQFFHPSKQIREKWPNEDNCCLTGVLVVGEGMRRVNRKEQMRYLMRLNDINNGTIFHIIKKSLRIDTAPVQPPSHARHVHKILLLCLARSQPRPFVWLQCHCKHWRWSVITCNEGEDQAALPARHHSWQQQQASAREPAAASTRRGASSWHVGEAPVL